MNPSLLPIPHTPCSHITSHWRMACCTFYFSQFPCEWIKWSGFPVMLPGFWGVVLKSGYCPAEFGKDAGRKRIKGKLPPTKNVGPQLIISYVLSFVVHPVVSSHCVILWHVFHIPSLPDLNVFFTFLLFFYPVFLPANSHPTWAEQTHSHWVSLERLPGLASKLWSPSQLRIDVERLA